uniref:Uncharacterized protein n=1 Tax=Caenorhabditis tropicalis TaxID=1561998 RepID=A0A1I7TW46_9PELO
MADEEISPDAAGQLLVDDSGEHPMEIEEETPSEDVPPEQEVEEQAPEPVETEDSEESIEKSRIQKESFLEIFRIAPRVKDILPDLRIFMEHPDVIEWDRKEVEMLVEIRIQEEKAKKKAEKASKKEAIVEKPPVALADVIRSAGIDLAGILQKLPNQGAPGAPIPPGIPAHLATSVPPPVIPQGPPPVTFVAPPPPILSLGTATITSIRRGKAGFSTPHPNEVPAELRHAKPDLVAPIPDELRNLSSRIVEKEVPAIPNELLPPEQRVYQDIPIVFVRPPLRKTLFLAGARSGKRSDRIKPEEKKGGGKKKKKKEELAEMDQNRPPPPPKRRPPRVNQLSGINALPQGLNKNSPLAVKRYHARQLAKDTGMSLEEAMAEIEEQCNEFGVADTEQAREYDAKAMELIRKHGDEKWNQRYNYTPADHSKGIPGVDRPPSGPPPKKDQRAPIPGVDRPPPGDRGREPIPGVDRPPGAREPIPGIDRPPGGYGIPGVDRPPGRGGFDDGYGDGGRGGKRRNRNRGGVKERERKRRRGQDQYYNGGYDGGYGGGYQEGGGYDEYYGSQGAGYEDYSNQYAEGGGAGYEQGEHPGYDSYATGEGGEGTSDQYYQGQDTYYQEDTSQYYDQYYGTTGEGGGGETEYHATFAEPANPPPPST